MEGTDHLMVWVCTAVSGTGSPVFVIYYLLFDGVTADKISRMSSVGYREILSAHIPSNASDEP